MTTGLPVLGISCVACQGSLSLKLDRVPRQLKRPDVAGRNPPPPRRLRRAEVGTRTFVSTNVHLADTAKRVSDMTDLFEFFIVLIVFR